MPNTDPLLSNEDGCEDGMALHWIQSPDGTRALALNPGHYSDPDFRSLFASERPIEPEALKRYIALARSNAARYSASAPHATSQVGGYALVEAAGGGRVLALSKAQLWRYMLSVGSLNVVGRVLHLKPVCFCERSGPAARSTTSRYLRVLSAPLAWGLARNIGMTVPATVPERGLRIVTHRTPAWLGRM